MLKALVVDDDEKNRKLIEDLLAIKKIEVASFERGEDAVQGVTEDMIFCIIDVRLPDIAGYEVAEKIKKRFPGMPCIAYTASALDESLERMKKSGAFDSIVLKPININEFFGIIDNFIKESRAR